MEIQFDRTIDDYIDFNQYFIAHSPSERRQMQTWRWVMSFLCAGLILAVGLPVARRPDIVWLAIGFAVLGGVLVYLTTPSSSRRSMVSRIQKMLKEGDNQGLFGPQNIQLSADGIFVRNHSGESRFNWTAVKKFEENDRQFFLYTSAINALVVPKRCLPSAQEQQDFRELINKYRPAA